MSEEVLLKNGIKEATVSIIKDLLNVQALSLNRMQTEFLQSGFLEKDRIIVSAPPASGKTLTVYLKYAKNLENGKKRMIYLLPYIRMKRELLTRLAKWKKDGILSTDDFDTYDEGKAQILVATYSSIDSLLLHGKKLSSDFFVFDEFDMVTDDLQGTKTEGVISRIIRESDAPSLYAISATIGSPELVEKWLNCVTFVSDFRPGDFKKEVKEFPSGTEQFKIIEDIFHSTLNEEKPMLVFYYNTSRCRQTALKMAKNRENKPKGSIDRNIAGGVKEIISKCDITSEINDQVVCLNNKVAFYFARLQPTCKEVVEGLLEKNVLDVVFTTPALARGINMPVRTVVIPYPSKYSKTYGMIPISRAEIEQILGRACRPPFHAKGFGLLVSTNSDKTKQLNEIISSKLEPMSSKFLQSAAKKGRVLNKQMLAVELIKEAKMRNRPESQLLTMFDSYLFMQAIQDKEGLYKTLRELTQSLIKASLLEKNIDGEIITPDIVDIIIDNGIDDIRRMLCLLNMSKDIVADKLNLLSGHILSTILFELCMTYSYFGIASIKEKFDSQKVQRYITEKVQIEPKKIDSEHRLFTALDLYANGTSLEKIENEFGIEPDSIPYVSGTVSQDLSLLGKLIVKQCMGDREKLNFSDFLEMSASVVKEGLPYQVLPFGELIDRLSRKTALRILEKYGSGSEVLKTLAEETRTEKEFREIEGIGRVLGQRIIDKRKELIANLQRKITLWGTYTSS